MASNHNKSLLKDYDKVLSEITKASILNKEQSDTIKVLNDKINTLVDVIAKKDEQINVLVLEVERLKNNNNKDSSNSSKPSSKDGFKKVENSREKTDKNQGGQKGHKGNTSEVSKVKSLIDTGKVKHTVIYINKSHKNKGKQYITRYVQDMEIITVIKEYRYYPNNKGLYNIPKEQNNVVTYGSNVKAISMLLVHRVPASMDQSVSFFEAITSEMADHLKEILHQKHLLEDKKIFVFNKETLEAYSQKYDDILNTEPKEYQSDIKTNAYKDEEKKLITRLKKYKENHLLFMHDFEIPFTNNRAETDIRPGKRKQNVGIFRSQDGATCYLRIRSFISTFLKNKLDIFEEIKNAFKNKAISLNLG